MEAALGRVPEPWSGEPESMVVTLDTGERAHYLDWRAALAPEDAERPALLLLHGLFATAWAWLPVARRLSTVSRVLAPDLRGHGLSDAPRGGYDLESLAFDALTVLSAAGLGADVGGAPAVVAGHGLGAMVAVTMSNLRPGSVSGLVLVDAGWERMADATGMDAGEFERTVGDPPEVLASMAAYLTDRRDFDPSSWDVDQERAARAAVDEKHAGHVTPVVRGHALRGLVDAMWSFDPFAAAQAPPPTLVAVAEPGADDELRRDRRLALEDVLRERSALGLGPPQVVRFGGAGHNLMRYRPVELSAAILELVELVTSARTPGGPG